jgi:DNA invertase Pin-like site-specific DNA recombinase
MADIGLARVSSLDQDPQLQINDLERAGCWPIYVEQVSGISTKRPVRDQALGQLQRNDTLTCWKLDRLGRSMTEVVGIIEDLIRRGVRFRCLTQPVDTTSAMGKMQLQLLAMFAEFERSLLLERTAAGRARRVAEGLHPGGVALYGFAADHVTVVEDEARLLRYVAEYAILAAPMNQIIDVINWRGYRTRAGKPWTVKTMVRIMRNPYVIPVLGEETFDKLTRIFGQPERQKLGPPATHLLSGILSCARCGQPLYLIHTRQRDGTMRDVYVCRKAGAGGRFTGCGSMVIGADRVHAWIEEMFVAAVVSEEWSASLAQRRAELLAGDVTAEELDAYRAEIAELEQVMPTRYAPPNAKERHDELRRMVDRATARLLAQPDLLAMSTLPRTDQELRRAWAAWSTSERRTWIKRLVSTVVVSPATSRGRGSDVESRLDPRFLI